MIRGIMGPTTQRISRVERALLPSGHFLQRCASPRAPGTAQCSPSVTVEIRSGETSRP